MGHKNDLLDELNEAGEKTGRTITSGDAHSNGLWHAGSHIWIFNKQKGILLQKRSSNKVNDPNVWVMAASGHVDAGELPSVAMVREVKEEIGLMVSQDEIEFAGKALLCQRLNNETYINNEHVSVYLLEKDVDVATLVIKEDEVSEVAWVDWAEYRKKISEGNPGYRQMPEEFTLVFPLLDKYFEYEG